MREGTVLFPTITFTAFFMVVWPVTWFAAGSPVRRQVVLVVASWVFYSYWDVRFLWLLIALILLNHSAARGIAALARWRIGAAVALWLGVGAHLAVLGWFKYYGFFATSLTEALGRLGVVISPPLLQVGLPLGISFLTFQAVSHLIETHRGVVEPGSLLEVAAWLSFFPTIASGPITRPSELLPQLRERPEPRIDANRAFALILRGLFKKVVLASYLASALADDVFANPGRYDAAEVLIGIYAYAAQIYVDFSGYTDMAIGLALLLGIRLPENFDAPYGARSVTDFWNRWHMTLSRWLRDFVFVPLAHRSPRTTLATCRNLVIVMALAGLWHGAAWTFVAFGLVHGVALAVERVLRQRRRAKGLPATPPGAARRLVHQAVAFHVVCLGWVFFRSESMPRALEVLGRLAAGWPGVPSVSPVLLAVLLGVIAVQNVPRAVRDRVSTVAQRVPVAPLVPALALSLVTIDVLGPEGVAPFLYFGF